MRGAITKPIFKLLSTSPSEESSQNRGLTIAKTRIVGASKRKRGTAADHFGPRTTRITSSAKRAQERVIRNVNAKATESPVRNYLLSRIRSSCSRDSAENATSPAAKFRLSTFYF